MALRRIILFANEIYVVHLHTHTKIQIIFAAARWKGRTSEEIESKRGTYFEEYKKNVAAKKKRCIISLSRL